MKVITQRYCGLDVNGWRDFATRNWNIDINDTKEIKVEVNLNAGGVLPVVVKSNNNWVGGIQAQLAPHGRGGGWGLIGTTENRESVCKCLKSLDKIDQLVGVVNGLVNEATHGIFAIEDVEDTTDEIREYYLKALANAKIRSKLLVWRPVLATLYAIEYVNECLNLNNNQLIGVICHSASGFNLQKLRLRKESGQSSEILAPERKKTGIKLKSNFGYQSLLKCATNQLDQSCKSEEFDDLSNTKALGQLIFGLKTNREVIRLHNKTWEIITPPNKLILPVLDLTTNDFSIFDDCDIVLLETLTQGSVRGQIFKKLDCLINANFQFLPPDAVARGALIATQRMAKNDPIYFDFLPIISTIVFEKCFPINHDLINSDETLVAGRMYTSPQPAEFQLRPGQEEIEVYLRKETHTKPRFSPIEIETPLKRTTSVKLMVEQVPASGRAKIFVNAPEISLQKIVDWENAREIDKTWEEVLKEVQPSEPTIPELLKLRCHIKAWGGKYSGFNSDMMNIIDENYHSHNPNWKLLADGLNYRLSLIDDEEAENQFEKFYCISSDGQLPKELDKDIIYKFEELTELALDHVKSRVEGKVVDNNGSLRFLTWQFKRCPEEITEFLLDACKTRDSADRHPFLKVSSGRYLAYQGLGRICTNNFETELINTLFNRPIKGWNWREEIACLAFLLSRSETAPELLNEKQVHDVSKRIINDLRTNIGTDYYRITYIPQLLVGLLRFRLKEPFALMYGLDDIANEFVETIIKIQDDMRGRKGQKRIVHLIAIFDEIIKEIKGVGAIPGLPGRIHSLTGG